MVHIRLRCRDGLLFYHFVNVQHFLYVIVYGTNFCIEWLFNIAANIDKYVASGMG